MPDPIPSLQMLGHAERGFDVGPADIVAVTVGSSRVRRALPLTAIPAQCSAMWSEVRCCSNWRANRSGSFTPAMRSGSLAVMSSTIRLPTTGPTYPPRSWRRWSVRPASRS